MMNSDTQSRNTVLLVGASRGLGYAMAEEFLKRGWDVVGTVRGNARTLLHELSQHFSGRLEIEALDMTMRDQIATLRSRLAERKLDMLFVSAGVTNNPKETIGEVSTEEFIRVMVTNCLSPMRVVEALYDLVIEEGTIGVMSSGQGSVSNNTNGMREVYRGSKAALNMCMRSFAARHSADRRAMVLLYGQTRVRAPHIGWCGDHSARCAWQPPGLQYLDYLGRTVPW
jgi:NAD(P)-dependent dehydrogenase (short-subunit alcohol dehydrogenase family)